MENIVGIWSDAEALNGRGTATLYNAESEKFYGPDNKRDVPCASCPLAKDCGVNATECSAFRCWASRGDFKDSDVGRFVRKIK